MAGNNRIYIEPWCREDPETLEWYCHMNALLNNSDFKGTGRLINASCDTCRSSAINERALAVATPFVIFLRIGIDRPEKPIYQFSQWVLKLAVFNIWCTRRSFSFFYLLEGWALDLVDWPVTIVLQCCEWHCWLAHLTPKIVSEMTYNVSSGTLNPMVSYHTVLVSTVLVWFIVHTAHVHYLLGVQHKPVLTQVCFSVSWVLYSIPVWNLCSCCHYDVFIQAEKCQQRRRKQRRRLWLTK